MYLRLVALIVVALIGARLVNNHFDGTGHATPRDWSLGYQTGLDLHHHAGQTSTELCQGAMSVLTSVTDTHQFLAGCTDALGN